MMRRRRCLSDLPGALKKRKTSHTQKRHLELACLLVHLISSFIHKVSMQKAKCDMRLRRAWEKKSSAFIMLPYERKSLNDSRLVCFLIISLLYENCFHFVIDDELFPGKTFATLRGALREWREVICCWCLFWHILRRPILRGKTLRRLDCSLTAWF